VHLFRHIGAMLFLETHPGALEVVRIMLGHKSTKTTSAFYARMKATKAVQLFTDAVLGERDLKIDQLKRGPGKK
jgi:site-specific recombinase XerD